MKHSRPDTQTNRHGFTLMELLLALVLTGMIMTAAFGAVHLSWKYRSAGEVQVEQSQTVRGVLKDITLDLRSTAVPIQQPSIDNASGKINGLPDDVAVLFRQLIHNDVKSDESFGPDIKERVLQFDSIDTINPIHFYGESDFLVLLSTSNNYRFPGSAEQHSTPMSHVVWSGSNAGSIRVPFNIRNDQLDFTTVQRTTVQRGTVQRGTDQRGTDQRGTVQRGTDQVGLIRIQQPLLSARTRTQALINAIVSDATDVSFRYSNGVEWRSTWNSHKTKRLPTAVELTFTLPKFSTQHRSVIRLPQGASL